MKDREVIKELAKHLINKFRKKPDNTNLKTYGRRKNNSKNIILIGLSTIAFFYILFGGNIETTEQTINTTTLEPQTNGDLTFLVMLMFVISIGVIVGGGAMVVSALRKIL